MKKIFLMFVACIGFCNIQAQQLSNGNFNGNWVDCHPWESGDYIQGTQGKQPEGWCISNVNGMGGLGATIVGSQNTDKNEPENTNKHSVTVTNTPNPFSASQIVPGYFTLGTAWATAKATITGKVSNADGGVFGGIEFKYQPDALHFYYKRKHNVENKTKYINEDEKASIIAYTWKGTWTQVSVPSNTAMKDPTQVTMTDRSNNILGKECLTGGTISKTEDAKLISYIEYYIEGNKTDWTEITIPFEYKDSKTKPEKLNIIFSANDMFADRSGIGSGNSLSIDDVELLYYNTLSSLTYNNVELIENNKTDYTVDEVYDASKLSYACKSQFANASVNYNAETGIVTITVNRANAETKTYTIQFNLPKTGEDTSYTEPLYVTVDGTTTNCGDANIIVTNYTDGTFDFSLKNFCLGEGDDIMPIGNINVNDLTLKADNTFSFNGNIIISAGDLEEISEEEWFGPIISSLDENGIPLIMTGKFENDKVYVNIDINFEALGQIINVHLGYDAAIMNINAAAGYGTFCAPFNVTIPENVEAYTINSAEESGLLNTTKITTGTIPAHTAVLTSADLEENMEMYHFGIATNGSASTGMLVGTYEDTYAPADSYILQNQSGKVGFYHVSTTHTVYANRCWLVAPDSSVKAFIIRTDETEGIKEQTTINKQQTIFNLLGQRINNVQKGVNIVNGKKVIR